MLGHWEAGIGCHSGHQGLWEAVHSQARSQQRLLILAEKGWRCSGGLGWGGRKCCVCQALPLQSSSSSSWQGGSCG